MIILILKITRGNLEKDYTFEGYTVYYLLFPYSNLRERERDLWIGI